MTHLHLDFETRSTVDIKKAGADVYARHPSTDVWCVAWHFEEDGYTCLARQKDLSLEEMHLGFGADVGLFEHVRSGGKVIAHNAAFELAVWNHVMVPRYGWPPLKPEQCICTMAMAYAMALPGSLDGAAAAVGLDQQKDMKAWRVMLQLSQPRSEKDGKIVWYTPESHPEKFETLYAYCKQDVEVERQLFKRLLQLSPAEQEMWLIDQRINQRGVQVDLKTVKAAKAIVEAEKARLDAKMRALTNNAVATCSAAKQITDWLRFRGVETAGVAKGDVVDLLADPALPADCRAVLKLRQEAAKSSTAKLDAMLLGVCDDGRLRGMFQYHAAAPGRWGGRRVQLQNLPRPVLPQEDIDGVFGILEQYEVPAPLIDNLYGSPMAVLSDCLRGFLIAEDGKDLVAGDFSAIEARVIAWLAGEEKVLEIFRTHGKIYEHAAAGIYRKPMEQVTKAERQIGKVAVLALGYQGGVGAFQTMARNYNVKVLDAEADEIKTAWRATHPNIKGYWYDLEGAALEALANQGAKIAAGAKGRQILYRVNGSFLWCRLPSGRVLCYPYPRVEEISTPWGEPKQAVTYQYVDSLTKKWVRGPTYGGSLAENVTQAVARDLLADAIKRLEANNYPVVMHCHDEAVSEVPHGFGSVEEMCALMSQLPPWAVGLPVAAEGWRGRRYQKG